RLLIEVKVNFGDEPYHKMVENHLPFNRHTAFMLTKIAMDKRITNVQFTERLPPSWYSLYELTHLKDSDFYQSVEKGLIHPGMTQKETKRLVSNPHASTPAVRTQSKRQSNGDADRQESAKSTNSPVSTAVKIIFTTGEFELVRNVMMVADRTGLVQEVAKRLWPSEEACLSMPPPDSYELAEKLEMEEVLVGLSAIGDWNTMEGEFSTESTGN
ncbi:MAG: hypothetical protein HQL90_11080, partial [Magnetococcales bacterium]|nr:hypothetical protein [Magnetococcales bacterium]